MQLEKTIEAELVSEFMKIAESIRDQARDHPTSFHRHLKSYKPLNVAYERSTEFSTVYI